MLNKENMQKKDLSGTIANCVYYSVGTRPCQFLETRWLGFDKHKKIVIGISLHLPTDITIVKLMIFAKKFQSVGTLKFPILEHWRAERVTSYNFSSTINDTGEYLGVLYYLSVTANLMGNKNLELYLFIISYETLNMKCFRINLLHDESVNMTIGSLFYSPRLKWVVSLRRPFAFRRTYYQLIIDEQTNECHLKLITSMPREITIAQLSCPFSELFIDKRLLLFLSAEIVYAFDFETQKWSNRTTGCSANTVGGFNKKWYVVLSDVDRHSFFAIPREPKADEYFLTLSELNTNKLVWRNSLYRFNSQYIENCTVFPVYGFCFKDLFFINAESRNIDHSGPSHGLHLIVVANQVLSLQDLAMKRLCEVCNDVFPLYEKRNAAKLNLTDSMIRTYFGPEWSLERFHMIRVTI